jgi:hypothetical protein
LQEKTLHAAASVPHGKLASVSRRKNLDDVCAQLDAPLPHPEAPPPAAAAADELSWRAQRLECLMLRVWWVSEAVRLFHQQYAPGSASGTTGVNGGGGGPQYQACLRATGWAKARAQELEDAVRTCVPSLLGQQPRCRAAPQSHLLLPCSSLLWLLLCGTFAFLYDPGHWRCAVPHVYDGTSSCRGA